MKYTACYGREEIKEFWPPPVSVLISITDPDSEPAGSVGSSLDILWEGCPYVDIIGLKFWDVEKPLFYYPKNTVLEPASQEQIETIYKFIKKYNSCNIFVHCEAGISRSAAVREYLIRRGWEYWENNGKRPVFPNNYILSRLERLDYPHE